jgi:hypothetical protein
MSSSEKSDQGTGIGVAFRGFEFHFGSETEGDRSKSGKTLASNRFANVNSRGVYDL